SGQGRRCGVPCLAGRGSKPRRTRDALAHREAARPRAGRHGDGRVGDRGRRVRGRGRRLLERPRDQHRHRPPQDRAAGQPDRSVTPGPERERNHRMSLAIDPTAAAPSGAERPAAADPWAREAGAVAVAALAAACLVWTPGKESPLPAVGWAAAFLFLAVQQDVRALRIPNWLTFPALAAAVALAALQGGCEGARHALARAGAPLAGPS